MQITLANLIQTWLKGRGLKWRFDADGSKLLLNEVDPLDVYVKIEKNRVIFHATTLHDQPQETTILASDPHFFAKLEEALRHEERWSHSAKCIVLLYNVEYGCSLGY